MIHPPDIEAVVREVVRRIRAAVGEERPAEPAAVVSDATKPPLPKQTPRRQMTLTQRLITLAVLEEDARRLDEVDRILVRDDAVVTPAVRDELRRRDIELIRHTASETRVASGPLPKLILAATEGVTDPRHRLGRLADCEMTLETLLVGPPTEVVGRLIRRMITTEAFGLLRTEKPFLCVCLANRHREIRAVMLSRLEQLEPAVAEAAPNLLVVDAAAFGPAQVQNVIRRWSQFPLDFAAGEVLPRV